MNSCTSRPRSPIRAITFTSRAHAGDHAQQRALADAAAGEDADSLPRAEQVRAVDGPKPVRAAPGCGCARAGSGGRPSRGYAPTASERSEAVDRVAEAVEYATDDASGRRRRRAAAERPHRRAERMAAISPAASAAHRARESPRLPPGPSDRRRAIDAAQLATPTASPMASTTRPIEPGDPAVTREPRHVGGAVHEAEATWCRSRLAMREPIVHAPSITGRSGRRQRAVTFDPKAAALRSSARQPPEDRASVRRPRTGRLRAERMTSRGLHRNSSGAVHGR